MSRPFSATVRELEPTLRPPPGPSTARFLYGVYRQGMLGYVESLWREHGDVFQARVGPRTMVFAMHPEAVEQVSISARAKYDKVRSYDDVREFLTGDGLLASTGPHWKRQRKLMSPFFKPSSVGAYAQIMIDHTEQLRQRWDSLARAGTEVEIAEEMTQVTAAIILRAMFDTQTTESVHEIRTAVETMIAFVNQRGMGLWLPLWVPTKMNRRYVAARDRMHRLIGELIATRRALPHASWPNDLLSQLMDARDEETGEGMSEDLLRAESITTFFAGHETTARTMTGAWYSLARNPQVAERLHEELDRVLGGQLPTLETVKQLPYTLAVVKEVLRLHPPAPFYARDAIEDDTIGGYDVRAGSAVLLSPYFTHRHPLFWDRPEVFEPERFMGEQTHHPRAYHPFAVGSRVCLGSHFALLESHLLLAILAQRFTPKLRPDYRAHWEMRGVLGLVGGLPMTIEAR